VILKPEQSRAARGLLDWSVVRVAARANLPANAVQSFERGEGVLKPGELIALRDTLERGGVEFIHGGRGGVRWRRAQARMGSGRASMRMKVSRDWLLTLALAGVALCLFALLLLGLAQRYL
jgi:hypothetical protein